MDVLFLTLGLVFLFAGAELLIRTASKVALHLGMSPLVVGLTVVAFGTSAPEMIVSVQTVWVGEGELALGNVVGSNIFNVLFILGLAATITPLRVDQNLIRLEVPLLVGLSALLFVLAVDGYIGGLDGLFLFVGLLLYTLWLILQSRRESGRGPGRGRFVPGSRSDRSRGFDVLLPGIGTIAALGLLVVGSSWFTGAATGIARSLGISEMVIGLTIVAAGTSFPEVATSVVGAARGQADVAVGNVVGSNIFNILGVLGLSGLVSPEGVRVVRSALVFDLPMMIVVAVACFPVFFSGQRIDRWEGGLFLGFYISYVAYLIGSNTTGFLPRTLPLMLLGFFLPIALISVFAVVRRRL